MDSFLDIWGCVVYPFIAIIQWSLLTQSDSVCQGLIYGSNRTVQNYSHWKSIMQKTSISGYQILKKICLGVTFLFWFGSQRFSNKTYEWKYATHDLYQIINASFDLGFILTYHFNVQVRGVLTIMLSIKKRDVDWFSGWQLYISRARLNWAPKAEPSLVFCFFSVNSLGGWYSLRWVYLPFIIPNCHS